MVERSYASTSLSRHLARGVVGLGALVGSVLLIPLVGPISLVLVPVGLVALHGCPMCWLIGLTETISRGRLQRSCQDDRCELHVRRVDERDETVAGRDGVGQPGEWGVHGNGRHRIPTGRILISRPSTGTDRQNPSSR